ncbi:hypothetical protein ACJIZ3_009722 [Penstemon smallii]|uniref:Uncharacterized protein n=1 Tax=Penstemon smallii TaxID=265156 RepID=A0ABD3TEE1_9LAMI
MERLNWNFDNTLLLFNGGLRGQMIVQNLWVMDWQLQNSQLERVDKSSPYHRSWFMLCLVFNLDGNRTFTCTQAQILGQVVFFEEKIKELIISTLDGVNMDMEKKVYGSLFSGAGRNINHGLE